jgi:heme O synthase-like polyprenyltransferase
VPVVLGRARTLRLLQAVNAALAAATLAVPLLGWARPLFALLAASSVYAWLYLRALAAGRDPHFLCDVVADGELLLLSVLVLLATL